jgi:DNA-binding PadR family transcriptional regulator
MHEYDTYDPNDTDPRTARRGRRGRPPFDGPPAFARAMAGRRGGPHFDPWARFPMGPGGSGGRFGGRGRSRRSRGDVRAAVQAPHAEHPMHRHHNIHEHEARTDGAWRVTPGSIYTTLQVLEDVGLVTAEKERGKRVFHLTDEGREAVEAQGDRKPWEEVAEDVDAGLVALRNELGNVVAATMQVGNAGNDAQVAAAKKVLGEARRQLYLLLAEVDTTDDIEPTAATTVAADTDDA